VEKDRGRSHALQTEDCSIPLSRHLARLKSLRRLYTEVGPPGFGDGLDARLQTL